MSLETATVTETPGPVSIETPEGPEPSVSIADHAAQFSPDRPSPAEPEDIPKTPANTGQFANKQPGRHHAQSQRATKEDVEQINTLTKELRELEAKAADKDPHAKDSPRVRTLKRQIAALKPIVEPPTSPTPAQSTIAETKPAITEKPGEFSEKEPVFEDFSADPTKYPDPLAAWMRAVARYEARKERWEESQQQQTSQAEAQERAQIDKFNASRTEFEKSTPDFAPVTEKFMAEVFLPPVLLNAIVRDVVLGPKFVYHLAQHPDLADELILLTHEKPLTDAFVATVQRRLTKEVQGAAVSTGSAPPPRPYSPPKPPNPVRTGPIKTADEPPDQAASIAEHRKHYGPR